MISSEEDGDTTLDLGHVQPEPNTEDSDSTLDLGHMQPEPNTDNIDATLDLGHMQPEPNTEDNDATLDLGYEQPERESVEPCLRAEWPWRQHCIRSNWNNSDTIKTKAEVPTSVWRRGFTRSKILLGVA